MKNYQVLIIRREGWMNQWKWILYYDKDEIGRSKKSFKNKKLAKIDCIKNCTVDVEFLEFLEQHTMAKKKAE